MILEAPEVELEMTHSFVTIPTEETLWSYCKEKYSRNQTAPSNKQTEKIAMSSKKIERK